MRESTSGKAPVKIRRAARRKARQRPPAAASTDHKAPAPLAAMLSGAEHSKLVGVACITALAAYVHYRLYPLISDNDSFYHLRWSWVYRTHGIFYSAFPWTQYSVVKTDAADLWFGFHVLGIPLSFGEPPLTGIYLGAFLVTIASLWLAFLSFRRLRVRWPLFWTLFVALITSDLLYRLTMLRPHPLSLGLVLLLFTYMVTEDSRRSHAVIFLLAAAFSWNHIAVVWLPVFVIGIVTLVRLLHRQWPEWGKLVSFFLGLPVGTLLRPHPAGGIHLAYLVFKLMAQKQANLQLPFGLELLPFYWINFVDQFVPLSILMLLAGGILVLLLVDKRFATIDPGTRIGMWSSLAIATIFFIMTFTVARRSHEMFVGFSAIFLSLLVPQWLATAKQSADTKLIILTACVTLTYASIRSLYRFEEIITRAFPPRKFAAVGQWLERNAAPGEIVFNPQWDRFGELFFWDPKNYYINGMDPFLEYAYDSSLYWKTHYYHHDVADEYTCGGYPCLDEQVVGTYEALKNDFHASYIVLEKDRNPKLNEFLSTAPQFTKVLETDTRVVLYKIN